MNMDHIEFDREPPANLTTMVMAFGGWIDAGQAATGALRHLVRDLSATRLAWIDPEQFFLFPISPQPHLGPFLRKQEELFRGYPSQPRGREVADQVAGLDRP